MLRAMIVLLLALLIAPAAMAQASNPFDPRPVATQAPAPSQPLVITPIGDNSILGWLFAGLMTIFTGLKGKEAFWPPKVTVDGGSPPAEDRSHVQEVINGALLQAVQSGLPGAALQSVLTLIPAIGPVLAKLEPTGRELLIHALTAKAGAAPDTGGIPPDLASKILGRLDELLNKPHFPPQA